MWALITKNQTSGVYPSVIKALAESVQTSFDDNSDFMPRGREKVIHSVGSVCPFRFDIDAASPFTGVFKPSSSSLGFVRLGSATAVDTSSGVVPGLGLKFLRTGVPSGNFVALVKLTPLPDKNYNFFALNFSNHIPPAEGVIAVLAKKFNQVSQCVSQVGLSDLATFDVDGARSPVPVFPYKLVLKPNVAISSAPTSSPGLQEAINAAVPAGTRLFDVYAYSTVQDFAAGAIAHLGAITTTDACVTSQFGDTQMMFRHQRIEDDWLLQPSWIAGPNNAIVAKECGVDTVTTTSPQRCATL